MIDVLLVRWILAWDVHALASDPFSWSALFDANIFYPAGASLALSEHLLGALPLYAPSLLLAGSVTAYNVWLLSTFVLSGTFMHLLVRRWTGVEAAAYASGLAFAFAPWRWPEGVGSPHLLQLQYFPLILLSLDALVTGKRLSNGVTAGLVLAIQTLCSYYLGYQAFLIAAIFLLVTLLVDGVQCIRSSIGALVVAAIVALILIIPPSLPYLAAAGRSELTAFDSNWSSELERIWLHAYLAFLPKMVGTASLALAALAIPLMLVSRGVGEARRLSSCAVLVLLGVLLMRGPVPISESIPSLYALLSMFIPGFEHLRAHNRFAFMVSLGCSVMVGFTVKCVLENAWMRAHPVVRRGVLACAIAAILAPVVRAETRLQGFAAAAVPEVHQWLARYGAGEPLLEVGRPKWRKLRDSIAMQDSTAHWLPLLNGYTGHIPAGYDFVAGLAETLPESSALEWLASCRDLRWIVAHGHVGVRLKAWRELDQVREVAVFPGRFGKDYLYEVKPVAESPCVPPPAGELGTREEIRGKIIIEVPQSWRPRRERLMSLTLENDGAAAWVGTVPDKKRRVHLRLSWLDDSGEIVGAPIDAPIAADVLPGQQARIGVWMTSPRERGEYKIEARLVLGVHPDERWIRSLAERLGESSDRTSQESNERRSHEIILGDSDVVIVK